MTRGAKRACDTEGNVSACVVSASFPSPAHIWREDAVVVHPQRVLLRQLPRTAHEKVVQAEGDVALKESGVISAATAIATDSRFGLTSLSTTIRSLRSSSTVQSYQLAKSASL
jgi:hypothetical protein